MAMPAPTFRIKICGITRADDARAAIEAGADAIGLNFYPKSSRYLDAEARGRVICKEVWFGTAKIVGVFVNASPVDIRHRIGDCRLNAVQFHGDESPSEVAEFSEIEVIRARRIGERGVAAIAEDLEACAAAGRLPDALLVDAAAPGQYGGTGKTVSWAGLADYPRWLGDLPLILAGGLTPENVAEAIRIVRPAGVDVASGVESSPGVKDHDKMRRFIEAAKTAFETL